jgi:hypothetical protein
MIKSMAIAAFVLFMAGTAIAQQKQPKRTKPATTAGTISPVDAARSSPSAANTHDGTMGASTGTGTTLEQNQAGNATSPRTTSTDANSSTRTGASAVKAKKKSRKSDS